MKITLLAVALLAGSPALAQVAFPGAFVDTTNLATKSDIAALQAAMPTVSTATPTCIADSAAVGTITNQFAPANHTHCSKIRKARITGVNTATYTWTYPVAFTAGVVPVCQAIVEDPANSATDVYNAQIGGAPTSTAAVFRITRQTTGLLALPTGALAINPTPGNVNLHLTCFEP